GVEHLELFRLERGLVHELCGREPRVERVSRGQIAEPQLHERAQIPGRAVREVHDAGWLPVDQDDVATPDVGCLHDGREDKPETARVNGRNALRWRAVAPIYDDQHRSGNDGNRATGKDRGRGT